MKIPIPPPPAPPPPPPPPRFLLDPYKIGGWCFLLGILLTLIALQGLSVFKRWSALEEAKIQVEVRRILGTCGCPGK